MIKLIATLAFLCNLGNACSQGVKSKKVVLSYEPGLSVAVDRNYAVLYVIPILQYFDPNLLTHNKLNVEFTLGEKLGLEFHTSYSACKLKNTSNSKNYVEQPKVKDFLVGFSWKFYQHKRDGTFSPSGRYIGFGLDFGYQNKLRTIIEYTVNPNTGFTEQDVFHFYDDVERTPLFLLSFDFGRNIVMSDHLLLGYGMQFGLGMSVKNIGATDILTLNLLNNQPLRYAGKTFIKIGFIL